MSPIYEYYCEKCDKKYERISRYEDKEKQCPACGTHNKRIVSKPGYRRDHTIFDTTDPDKIWKMPT